MNRSGGFGRGRCWMPEDDWDKGAGRGGDPRGGGRGRCRGGRDDRRGMPAEAGDNSSDPRAFRGVSPWEFPERLEKRVALLEERLAPKE